MTRPAFGIQSGRQQGDCLRGYTLQQADLFSKTGKKNQSNVFFSAFSGVAIPLKGERSPSDPLSPSLACCNRG